MFQGQEDKAVFLPSVGLLLLRKPVMSSMNGSRKVAITDSISCERCLQAIRRERQWIQAASTTIFGGGAGSTFGKAGALVPGMLRAGSPD